MGVNANITVYGWRKPTLELELVEGGSLAPNTTYYVAGVMAMTPRTYIAIGSEPSDVYDITTTTTALSIKITQKTYRDVSGFSDNGDNRTLVACTRHCFESGDTVKFATGSYAGTYTVVWVDYHQFIIDTPYVDNVATQCYSDSQDYNQPGGLDRASGMAYYVHTVAPSWGTNRWTRTAYQTTNIENPTTITAVPTTNFGDYAIIPEILGLHGGLFDVLLGYGTPYIDVTGAVTANDIETEVGLSGFSYHFGYSTQGYDFAGQLNIMAAIRFTANASMTVSNAVVMLLAEFESDVTENVVFNSCMINCIVSTFTGYYEFLANNCTFFNGSDTNTTGGWILGDNIRFYSVPRFGSYGDDTGTYIDQYGGTERNYGLVENKIYSQLYNRDQTMQISYASTVFKNCTLFSMYAPTNPGTDGLYPDIYMMENCIINESLYPWHFRWYAYGGTEELRHDYLNINTDDPDNIKKNVNNGAGKYRMYFYRRLEFYVQADQVMLEGASITIVDNDDNTYNTTTDENGYGYIDVVEQFWSKEVADGTQTSWNGVYDTFYNNFNVTFSATGYYDETLLLEDAYGNELNNVSLVELPPVQPLSVKGLKIT